MTRKHPTSSVFVFRRIGQGEGQGQDQGQDQGEGQAWRLGLIQHPRLGRMMIPGGHVEQEESQGEAALREVAEETGLAVQLVSPPAAAMPSRYRRQRVAQPWWIVEYQVPPDNHLGADHVHIDHLYVALADGAEPVGEAAHPFGWYAATDLPSLHMFDDARVLALALLSGLSLLHGDAGDVSPARLGNALLTCLNR